MKLSRLLIIAITVLTFLAGCDQFEKKATDPQADKDIEAAYKARDYQKIILLADSFQQSGAMSDVKAYYWQGYARDRLQRYLSAEYFWGRALRAAENSQDPEEIEYYTRSAARLANMLTTRGDYEVMVKKAGPVVKRLEELGCDSTSDYVNLLIYIGCCQLGLGMSGDTIDNNFYTAYKKHNDEIEYKHNDLSYKNAFAGLINIVYALNETRHFDAALRWNERYGKFISEYEQRNDVAGDYVDKQWARYDIYQAIALAGLQRFDEAEKAYADYQSTQFSKTPEGQIEANKYLEPLGRWTEAAANYESLDKIVEHGSNKFSLESMQKAALKKYRANLMAGRRDTAMAVSMQISNMLDSAIARSRRIDAEEQVVIQANELLEDQQKEAAAQRRLIGYFTIAAIVAGLFVLAILYLIGNLRHSKHSRQDLQWAYDQLESDTVARERKENEQRIAHDIQLAMAPRDLPPHKHLAVAATQSGEKNNDSGLYELAMAGPDQLLFCIADANSSSDVRASFATALVKAQFRSMISVTADPQQIICGINEAMAPNKFTPVTLFIGLLDLATGRLRYSNAGHLSPLIAGTDIFLLPQCDDVAIGMQSGHAYKVNEIELEPDTIILLYSNALGEARSTGRKKFGEGQMLGEALQLKKTGGTPEVFVTRLTDSVHRFTGQELDPTMIAIQYK
jgi:serine phosphatase RsbU (regulator of sigma subunit)